MGGFGRRLEGGKKEDAKILHPSFSAWGDKDSVIPLLPFSWTDWPGSELLLDDSYF